jgi:hypothetical protein
MDNAARENYSEFIDELGLVFVPGRDLTDEDLTNIFEVGDTMSSSSSFLRGDILNHARKNGNDELINRLSMSLNLATLNNYASICSTFPRDRRRRSSFLKFRHYDAIKAIKDPVQQDYWLDRAEKERMSSDLLRKVIKESVPVLTRRMSEEMQVGLIDLSLMEDYGVAEGTIVRVIFEIEIPKDEVVLAAA